MTQKFCPGCQLWVQRYASGKRLAANALCESCIDKASPFDVKKPLAPPQRLGDRSFALRSRSSFDPKRRY